MVRNAGWVAVGGAAPGLVGLAVVPWLNAALGPPRFGLLVWVGTILQVATLFDLGLGRALARAVAEGQARGSPEATGRAVATAVRALAVVSVGAGLALLAAAPAAAELLRSPAGLRAEAVGALRLAALGVGATILATGAIGALEGAGAFARAAAVRGLLGASVFLGPAVAVLAAPTVATAVAGGVGLRVVAAGLGWGLALARLPGWQGGAAGGPDWGVLRFAGWVTVSAVLGVVLGYAERFLLGARAGAAALAAYVPPAELLLRAGVMADAVVAALLPATAARVARAEPEALRRLYRRLGEGLAGVMGSGCALLALWAPDIARLWLGSPLAPTSAAVLRGLAVGMFLNALARLPTTALYAVGRADVVARLHVLEAGVYLPLVGVLVERGGAVGAAAAWSLRAAVDAVALLASARRCGAPWARLPAAPTLAGLALVTAGALGVLDPWPGARVSASVLGLGAGAAGALRAARRGAHGRR